MVFQHFMLADNLTVLENVVLGAEKLHGIGGAARAEITRISDSYGLGIEPDRLVEELGVGARQRVEILKVLYRGAQVVILDEPTAVLVPQEVDELFGNLRGLKERRPQRHLHLAQARRGALRRRRDHRDPPRYDGERPSAPEEVTARQLAELMVGSELPVAEHRVVHRDRAGAAVGQGARRYPIRTAARCSTASPSTSTRARCSASPASRATGRPSWSRRSWACVREPPARSCWARQTCRRCRPATVAKPASATSPRTATATASCSTRRCGRTACSATRPGPRATGTASSTSARRAPTPSGSSRRTTSARPVPTCSPGRCPAATSRS